jgi:hypothetical protein
LEFEYIVERDIRVADNKPIYHNISGGPLPGWGARTRLSVGGGPGGPSSPEIMGPPSASKNRRRERPWDGEVHAPRACRAGGMRVGRPCRCSQYTSTGRHRPRW